MRTLAKTAVALTFIGAAAIGTTATVQAQGGYGYYPHPYYHGYYYHQVRFPLAAVFMPMRRLKPEAPAGQVCSLMTRAT